MRRDGGAAAIPDDPQRGTEIRGLAAASDPTSRFSMPARAREGERLIADGGRVLGVTALGTDLAAARARAYAAIDKIDWPEGFCRRDIGLRGGHWRRIGIAAEPRSAGRRWADAPGVAADGRKSAIAAATNRWRRRAAAPT